jgi:L-threonylcarbamoyladenylate synthase
MIIEKSAADSAEKTARILQQGLVAILPTDTIYGFSGIVPDTEETIRQMKGREIQNPFIRLLANPEDIRTSTDADIPSALLSLWPGPLTLVVPLKTRWRNASETAAFRCPGDNWLRQVISLTGKSIYSTSVNTAGRSPLTAIKDIIRDFGGKVSLIVSAGDCENVQPSTLVDITGGECKVLRQGVLQIPAEC